MKSNKEARIIKSDKSEGTNLAKVLWYYNYLRNKEHVPDSIKVICPFHDDVNPSLLVDIKNGSWFCFACQEHGDAYKFVRLMNQKKSMNSLQSIIDYNKIINSELTSDIYIEPSSKKPAVLDYELYDHAYDYYHGLRKVDWRVSEHLTDEEEQVLQYMKARGFSEYSLTKSIAKATYNKSYPIIFPMIDNGEFKGWVCRTTNKEIEKKRKYLYNTGFSRSTTLVGNYGSEDYVIVVEGYIDRLKIIQYGEDNVVAILGWKMTHEQIQKLKDKGIKTIISALDNDTCGKKGTEYLKQHFDVIRFSYLKGVKDPGEMTEEQFDKSYYKTMSKYEGYLQTNKSKGK